MTNTTSTSVTFNPVAARTPVSLWRELFQATPLYIFATALMTAFRKPAQR